MRVQAVRMLRTFDGLPVRGVFIAEGKVPITLHEHGPADSLQGNDGSVLHCLGGKVKNVIKTLQSNAPKVTTYLHIFITTYFNLYLLKFYSTCLFRSVVATSSLEVFVLFFYYDILKYSLAQ